MTLVALFEPQPRIGSRVERWLSRLGLQVWQAGEGTPDAAVVCIDGPGDWEPFAEALPEGVPIVATAFRSASLRVDDAPWSAGLLRPFARGDLSDALQAAGLVWESPEHTRETADYATTGDHERPPSVTPVAGVDVVVSVDDADVVEIDESEILAVEPADDATARHALTAARLVDYWATLQGEERVAAVADFLASLDED